MYPVCIKLWFKISINGLSCVLTILNQFFTMVFIAVDLNFEGSILEPPVPKPCGSYHILKGQSEIGPCTLEFTHS